MQFQNTTLSAEMLQAIATQNFTEMTEIQAKTIPPAARRQRRHRKIQHGYGQNCRIQHSHY